MDILAREPALAASPLRAAPLEETAFLHAPRTSGRWPLLILRWGGFEAEIDGPFCGFLRLGKLESYARWDDESGWYWQRDPGALEISAGRYRVTLSRQPEA
ncbi:hypothetical protein [Teichococcus oryzae]|uniref:Uncharacterized protein n=1 Tax=Teichococcus oryzae TaxID=1608942 RepID=A0A5B2TFE4_9PROT|nr:hypothetical protein [Pseudoroseomonas oryzae]KAA2213216.1 hypothetical protein F0Q34_11330 [Pseudoroseomonas oryzae]